MVLHIHGAWSGWTKRDADFLLRPQEALLRSVEELRD